MEKSALVFLEERKARLLVAAWKQVPPLMPNEDAELSIWSMAAGVERSAARRLRPVLLANQVIGIGEDGMRWVDHLAEEVIAAAAAVKMNG